MESKQSKVTQILGRVEVKKATLAGEAYENSTRWVFDVEHEGGEVVLSLKHKYASQAHLPAVRSFSITALDRRCHGADVWLEERGEAFALHAKNPCKFRVAVDTIHSATR